MARYRSSLGTRARKNHNSSNNKNTRRCTAIILLTAILLWLALWIVWFSWGLELLVLHRPPTNATTTLRSTRRAPPTSTPQSQQQLQHSFSHPSPPTLPNATGSSVVLLTDPKQQQATVHVTTDVRGNLGPAKVMLDPNGTDWLHDRWQAASDMHGTAIHGAHWVQLDFETAIVVPTRIVLDWETSYSKDYRIEGRLLCEKTRVKNHPTCGDETNRAIQSPGSTTLFYDTKQQHQAAPPILSVREYGQSPGVQQKLPLHVIHTLQLHSNTTDAVNQLRLLIRSPFHKAWGVSLWSFQVWGYYYNVDEYRPP